MNFLNHDISINFGLLGTRTLFGSRTITVIFDDCFFLFECHVHKLLTQFDMVSTRFCFRFAFIVHHFAIANDFDGATLVYLSTLQFTRCQSGTFNRVFVNIRFDGIGRQPTQPVVPWKKHSYRYNAKCQTYSVQKDSSLKCHSAKILPNRVQGKAVSPRTNLFGVALLEEHTNLRNSPILTKFAPKTKT